MRVMQTFGEPRDTTNPYLVMLRDALVAEPTIEHVPFSWRAALTGRYDVLHVHWPDTAPRCAPLVDEGRQARGPRRPRRAPRSSPDRRRAHRAQRHAAVGPVPRPGAHPGAGAADRRSDPHLRVDPGGGRRPLGADPARALSRLVRRHAASRRSARATRVRRPDQALQGRRATRRRLRCGIRPRSGTHPPDRRASRPTTPSSGGCAPHPTGSAGSRRRWSTSARPPSSRRSPRASSSCCRTGSCTTRVPRWRRSRSAAPCSSPTTTSIAPCRRRSGPAGCTCSPESSRPSALLDAMHAVRTAAA